ncbi:MAG: DUF5666 domain-containing protein [Marinobacterium sp.]|nr:DUF5666 domain-containing protein [Marinobacterium sp.]
MLPARPFVYHCQNILLTLLCSLLLVSCQTTPDYAAQDRGIGGSGRQPDSERGIDGSGMVAGQDRGIGGSGRQLDNERGIGGSERQLVQTLQPGERIGIVGTITAFGSVWVNDLHIHYDERTLLSTDGQPTYADQLKLGQRAVISANLQQGQLYANSLDVIHEVSGPVSSIDAIGRNFSVLGQTITVTTDIPLPAAGNWVAVSGIRTGTDTIQATRLDAIEKHSDVLLRGQLSYQYGQPQISGQLVDLPDSLGHPVDNSFIMLRGQLHGDKIQGTELVRPQKLDKSVGVNVLSIERPASLQNQPGPYTPTQNGAALPAVIQHWHSSERQTKQPPAPRSAAKTATGSETGTTTSTSTSVAPLQPSVRPQPDSAPLSASVPHPAARPAPAIRPAPLQRLDTISRPEQVMRPERPAAPERPVTIERPERPETPERPITPERPQRPSGPQRPSRPAGRE